MKTLAIITTHPIQYYAPVFRLIHSRGHIRIKVYYTWGEDAIKKYDPGFKKEVEWDIPLLEGYTFEWLTNVAKRPGSHHFNGIVNPDITQIIEELNPDAILVLGWAYNSHLKVLRHFKNKIPIYFRGDSTLMDTKSKLKEIFKTIFLKWVYTHVSHAFYVGTQNKAYFEKYGLKEQQLTFAPHAIDNDRFGVERNLEAVALRNTLGLVPSDILIVFAGKLEEKKDPLLLVNAFLRLKQKSCHLLIVGNGPLEMELRKRASSETNIHFKDMQNQSYMPIIYQAANLFCLPSKGPAESWGLAVNEAMATARAILVSDKAGCAVDLVAENRNGATFIANNMADLLQKLRSLTQSHSLLQSFGNASLERVQAWNFTNIAIAIETKLLDEKNE